MADPASPNPDPMPAVPQNAATPSNGDRRKESLIVNPQFLLVVLITCGLFAMWATVTFKAIPQENHDIIIAILSSVTTGWVAGVGYFFGSNAASRTKDNAIAAFAAKPSGVPNA